MLKALILRDDFTYSDELREHWSNATAELNLGLMNDRVYEYIGSLIIAENDGNTDYAEKLKKRGVDISKTLIISCDTVVCYDGMVIGKPLDDAHSILTLGVLSESWHSVYSGLTLRLGAKTYTDFARTDVKFREISEKEIKQYVETGEPRGKAGSYAIQMLGSSFAERIEGDFYNIVGFPVALFTRMLKVYFGTDIFDIAEL
jgi:MAF protein